MPVSEQDYKPSKATGIAVTAESLYLINLLLLPGLGFLLLLLLYWKRYQQASAFTLNHLQQTLFASLWAGFMIIVVLALSLLLGGINGPYSWMIAIIYFTVVHSSFIFLGMVGLIKALAGQCWSYPVVGKPIPDGCQKLR